MNPNEPAPPPESGPPVDPAAALAAGYRAKIDRLLQQARADAERGLADAEQLRQRIGEAFASAGAGDPPTYTLRELLGTSTRMVRRDIAAPNGANPPATTTSFAQAMQQARAAMQRTVALTSAALAAKPPA